MKNSIKRAQSQARLSFAERENFRPKVKQLKKTILTLVALLAVTTGAWAQGYNVTFGGFSESEMNTTVNVASLPQTFTTIGHDALYPWTVISTSGNIFYNATVTSGGEGKVSANIVNDEEMTITITGPFSGTATIHVTGEDDENRNISTDITVSCEAVGGTAEPSGPEVAWDKATKSGTFTMPGGNVTLEPEYYPQATLTAAPTAINDVPATTDGAIVNAGTVANIGSTETAQGTVMYYVSTTPLDDAALLALAADQWTADVPTAADLAQGQAYVYYYVRGNDSDTDDENFSDGDILAANALTVTIAAAPTYAVTFAEGTDPNEWTASPAADVTKGETVTVTYSGTKKVIGVKAEKKAAAKPVTLATALEDGATIKVNFKWRNNDKGDYVQGVYNATSGTFTASKGGGSWGKDGRAVYKVEKSGDNIIIGAGLSDYNTEGMVWTFNTTNDTYTTTNGADVKQFPTEYGLISVSVNDTDITSTLSELK